MGDPAGRGPRRADTGPRSAAAMVGGARRLAGVDASGVAQLWRSAPATQWQECGTTLAGWAWLHAWMAIKGPTPAGIGELRHIGEAHGLSPKALLSLRWIIAPAAPVESTPATSPRSKTTGIDRRSRLLAVVAKAEHGRAT